MCEGVLIELREVNTSSIYMYNWNKSEDVQLFMRKVSFNMLLSEVAITYNGMDKGDIHNISILKFDLVAKITKFNCKIYCS